MTLLSVTKIEWTLVLVVVTDVACLSFPEYLVTDYNIEIV